MSDQTLFSEDKTGAKFGKFIFLLAFCLFLFFQVRITLVPMLERQVQVEADDAYNLILKAEQINNSCFFQDCPALNDLRQELYSPDSDPDVSSIRRRVYQRVFLVYNPLHSVTLVLLK